MSYRLERKKKDVIHTYDIIMPLSWFNPDTFRDKCTFVQQFNPLNIMISLQKNVVAIWDHKKQSLGEKKL